jgi:hypothetical protein
MTTISSTQDEARLLRSALLGNSIFSLLSGLDFVLFSRPVAAFLGLSSPIVILVLGVILIVYAYVVFSQARTQPLDQSFARFAIVADLLWVIGSAVLIFTDLVAFTTAGKWTIAIIADVVLVFAIAQYVGLRRITNRQ